MTSIPEPVTAEIEDLREFVRECTLGILDSVPDLPKREAEMEAAVLCGAYARRCGHQWASLRKVLADYPELLAQVPDKPGPVDALPLLPRRGHGPRAQGQARAAAGDVRRGAGGEGRTAYQAHREGIRKLREWEDNDFDRARYESRMRLFDDEMEDTSKCLSRGGMALSESVVQGFVFRLDRAARLAQNVGRMDMTDAGWGIWDSVYPDLSEGSPGLFVAATARAEAQVVRLAMLYALLDEKAQIDAPHLLAALAVWEYAEESARHAFGSSWRSGRR